MKKIFLFLCLFTSLAFADTFATIIKNVSIVNVNKAVEDIDLLKKSYSKEDFKSFVKSWKKVQAVYLAGDINSDYIDIPRYIDIFHHGNEDITKQLNRVILSKDDVQIELFKNSNKSINAVEYMLFKSSNALNKREKAMLDVMFLAIKNHLLEIKKAYEQYLKNPKNDEQWGNSVVINRLIDSTYKLKEWRVGDPAGLSKKYNGKADNKRAEYALSLQSFNAIKAILEAHEEIIGKNSKANFAKMAIKSGASKQIMQTRQALKEAKKELNKLKNDDFSNAKALFEKLSIFHNAYYLSLIEQLSVTAKILDADGD